MRLRHRQQQSQALTKSSHSSIGSDPPAGSRMCLAWPNISSSQRLISNTHLNYKVNWREMIPKCIANHLSFVDSLWRERVFCRVAKEVAPLVCPPPVCWCITTRAVAQPAPQSRHFILSTTNCQTWNQIFFNLLHVSFSEAASQS